MSVRSPLRHITCFAATCACLASLGTSTLLAENLVENGGFEKIDEKSAFASGWGKHWIYTGEYKSISDPKQSHGGISFVSLAQAGPGASDQFVTLGSPRYTPTGGRKYKLSVWAKGKGQLTAMAYLYGAGNFLKPDANAVAPAAWKQVGTDRWQQYTFDVSIPASSLHEESKQNQNVDQFEVLFNVKNGPVFLDDVELHPADDQPSPQAKAGVKIDAKSLPLTTFTTMPAPKIDGVVDPAEWSRASGTTGFFVQGGTEQAGRQTQVYVGFDEKNLYVAFESRQDALTIKEVAPAPNASLSNDVEGFELWLKPPGKSYFQFVGMPGGATFMKAEELSHPTWGKGSQYASKVVDSGEMHGGILSLGKKTWSGEIAIPFADMGLTTPADGESWKVNFCRDFSVAEGKARLPQDWTTWAPLRNSFAEVEGFGLAQFSRKAPVVRLSAFGDLKSGDLKLRGSNEGPVNLQTVAVLDQVPDKYLIDRQVKRTENGTFDIDELIKTTTTGTARMTLFTTAKDAEGKLLAQSRIPFAIQPSFWLEPRLLYSQKKVEVSIGASRLAQLPSDARIRLTVQKGEEAPVAEVTQDLDPKKLNFDTSLNVGNAPAGEYTVNGYVINRAGETLARTAEPLNVPQKPEWFENQIGVTDDVPAPFTPITVEGKKVGIVQREYVLQDSGFPQSVIAKGEEMLTGPIAIRAIVDGKPVQWAFKPLEQVSRKPGEVIWKVLATSAKLDLAGTLKLDFDGFGLWDVKFTPKGAVKIDALSLDVPVKKEHAFFAKGDGSAVASIMQDRFTTAPGREDTVTLGNRVTEWGSWSYSRKGWIWPTQFFNEIYIGSDQRGFSLMTETKRNVYGEKYAEFLPQEDAKTLLMRINLISEPTTLKEELPYTYFYQTTPVRPEPTDPKKWHITYDPSSVYTSSLPGYTSAEGKAFLAKCDVGMAYYDLLPDGYPNWLHSAEESKSGMKKFQDMGMKITTNLWYSAVADSLPEYKIFGSEWSAAPTYGWPSPNANLKSACLNSSYQQFMIRNTEKIINEMGFDGVYTDATAVPCSNGRHNCGYVGRDGKRHADLNMLATRSFVKRMYSVLKAGGKDRVNFSHSGESTSTAAFVDVRTHGEELCQEEKDHYKRFSPDYFRAKYAQNEYGVPYTFQAIFHYQWRAVGEQVPMSEILMMCLAHRTMPTLAYNLELVPVWNVFDPFWTSAQFVPYWKPEAPATTADPINVLSSTFLKKENGEALIVVSNWKYEATSTKVTLDAAKLGFTPGSVSLIDVPTGNAKPLDLGNISVDLKSRDYQVLLVKKSK